MLNTKQGIGMVLVYSIDVLLNYNGGKLQLYNREIGQHPNWVIKIDITNDGQLAKVHLQMGYSENSTSSMNYSVLECIT